MKTSKLKRLTAVTQQLGASQLASFSYRLTLIVVVVFGLNSCKNDDLDKFLDPETKSAVAILTNRENFTKWKVAAKVAKMVFTAE